MTDPGDGRPSPDDVLPGHDDAPLPDTFEVPMERPPSHRWAIVAVATLLAIALPVALIGYSTWNRTPTTDRGNVEGLPAVDSADDLISEISDFVARERGLEFLEPVEVERLDDDAFVEALLADFEDDIDEIVATEVSLKALGAMDPGADLVTALKKLYGEGVVGFYDDHTGRLVVRGTQTSPYARSVIAHELTHALQDQHFELDRPEYDDRDDEIGLGFSTLVEGDAQRIGDAYVDSLPAAEQDAARAEELRVGVGADLSGVPEFVLLSASFPYSTGPRFVDELLAAGGQPRLDAAFEEPPTTSEQLLSPQTYFDGEGRLDVAPPNADGDVVDEGVFGVLAIRLILATEVATRDIDRAVEGWGGDWYVAWQDDSGRSCLRAAFVGDTDTDTEELGDVWTEWADAQPGAGTVVEDGRVVLTSCSVLPGDVAAA